MKLSDLLRRSGIRAEIGADPDILGVTDDSRSVRPGWLFVGVKGTKFDGRAFVGDAQRNGAAVIAGVPPIEIAAGVPFLPLTDDRDAVARLARAFFHEDAGRRTTSYGITGTNGKTTITHILESIHAAADRRCGVVGTIEYRLGEWREPSRNTTPGAIDLWRILAEMRRRGAAAVAMEVSSHALTQHRVDGVSFDAAVVTNITSDHLDYHASFEAYREAKATIFSHLSAAGAAIVNADDPSCKMLEDLVPAGRRIIRTSLDENRPDSSSARIVSHGTEGLRLAIRCEGRDFEVSSRLFGRHNAMNILQAVAAAVACDVPTEAIVRGVAALESVPGRLERVDLGAPFEVVVDYAHTADAMEHVLATLRAICRGRLVVVFGCGGDRDRTKRPVMGAAAERLADAVILTSDNPRSENVASIVGQILAGVRAPERVLVEYERGQAILEAVRRARRSDIILIAGKGHETRQLFAAHSVPHDDRHAARNAWAAVRRGGRS